MQQARMAYGWAVGLGAAQNISVGFVPDVVMVWNLTDADRCDIWFRGREMVFTSGGTTEIKAGSYIKGATSGATGRVDQVLLTSGTWAGGDAAGSFIIDFSTITGTFSSENVFIYQGNNVQSPLGTNDATVVVDVDHDLVLTTALASGTPSATITHYAGSSTAAPGFTIGATTAENAKTLRWIAFACEGNAPVIP